MSLVEIGALVSAFALGAAIACFATIYLMLREMEKAQAARERLQRRYGT